MQTLNQILENQVRLSRSGTKPMESKESLPNGDNGASRSISGAKSESSALPANSGSTGQAMIARCQKSGTGTKLGNDGQLVKETLVRYQVPNGEFMLVKECLNPANASTLSRICLWKKARDTNTWGLGDMPQGLFTPERMANWEAVIAALNVLLEPIDKRNCRSYLQSFSSAYAFAFGDKDNRDSAIANWNVELINYPDWAVRRALSELRQTFKGGHVMVVGMAIELLKKYTKDFYRQCDIMKEIATTGKMFSSDEELVEYKIAKKEDQEV